MPPRPFIPGDRGRIKTIALRPSTGDVWSTDPMIWSQDGLFSDVAAAQPAARAAVDIIHRLLPQDGISNGAAAASHSGCVV